MEERLVDDAKRTRARHALAAAALTALLALAGCGGSGDDAATGAGSGATPATSTESTNTEPATDSSASLDPTAPEPVTVQELREAAAKQKTPIYWAGERQGTKLALSPLRPYTEGRTFVRYLTGGASADDTRPDFLTVVTYLQPNPAAIQKQQAEDSGSPITITPKGTKVWYDRSQPESIFLVFPGVDVEVEVFAPTDFQQVLRLVNSDGIVPVD